MLLNCYTPRQFNGSTQIEKLLLLAIRDLQNKTNSIAQNRVHTFIFRKKKYIKNFSHYLLSIRRKKKTSRITFIDSHAHVDISIIVKK